MVAMNVALNIRHVRVVKYSPLVIKRPCHDRLRRTHTRGPDSAKWG